jgi:uncharacterized membrane protein YeaQ/YmgE (transglycosylase-associated protein family)
MILGAFSYTVSVSDLTLWILGAALAGVSIGQLMAGRFMELVGDLIAGIVGGLAAVGLVGFLMDMAALGFWTRPVVAVVGAAILVGLVRGGGHYRRMHTPASSPLSPPTTPDDSYETPTAAPE